jgi:hypothetical protein
MAKGRNDRQREEQRAAQAAQREAFVRRQQRNKLLLGAAVALAVLSAAAFGYRFFQQRQLLATVTTANYPAGLHVAGKITWTENPPIGGAHNVAWQNCRVYNEPIHNEHAVHSLEHGAVWITYRPDLPADQVQRLVTLAADDYMLVSPYPGLPVPVIASAWNHQIRLDGAADPRLVAFIDEYRNNPQNTPEFGASCFGAIASTATTNTLVNPSGPMAR